MTRRRGNGEDSVYKDGDRWRGAVSLGYDSNGRRVRKKVSGRTRAETVEKPRKLRQQMDAGIVPNDRLTIGAFLDRWLSVNVPGTVAESTEDDYNDTVRLHLRPALGSKRLTRLTVAELDKLWNAKREAGYSANSVRIMRTVLRRALGQAERESIVARNVAALSSPPRIRAKEGRTLTVQQDRQLLAAVAGDRIEVAVVIALAYGMRRVNCGRSTAVFASEVGTPFDPDNFSHAFSRLCESAGLGHWHARELRHLGASLMLAQGTPLHVVSEVLGHASIAITKDVYGHLVEGTSGPPQSR